jgi:hypothetical protein
MKTIILILMTLATMAMARGHDERSTAKISDAQLREVVEVEFEQIIALQPRLAVAAWIALDPSQRQQILHYTTPQEQAVIVRDFEYILKIDGLKPQ